MLPLIALVASVIVLLISGYLLFRPRTPKPRYPSMAPKEALRKSYDISKNEYPRTAPKKPFKSEDLPTGLRERRTARSWGGAGRDSTPPPAVYDPPAPTFDAPSHSHHVDHGGHFGGAGSSGSYDAPSHSSHDYGSSCSSSDYSSSDSSSCSSPDTSSS